MRKCYVLMLGIAIVAVLCSSCGNKKNNQQADKVIVTKAGEQLPQYGLDSLLSLADQFVGKKVVVKGSVTHTCKHSGKRCFIVGEDPKVSMRVEAKGEIGGFNRELIGSELKITGILRERRLTKEYIDQIEKETEEKAKEDGSAESCEAEINNIKGMRAWMADHHKDFYSLYYLDGQDYEVVEE